MTQLILVPAGQENRHSLEPGVDRSILASFWAEEALEAILQPNGKGLVWGAKEGNRSKWLAMQEGDLVAFVFRGENRFAYCAELLGKLESPGLANELWQDTSFRFTYVVGPLAKCVRSKPAVLSACGYGRTDRLMGLRLIKGDHSRTLLRRFGSLQKVRDWLTGGTESEDASPTLGASPVPPLRRQVSHDRVAESLSMASNRWQPKELASLVAQIEALRKDPGHTERDHEQLVHELFRVLEVVPRCALLHQREFADLVVVKDGKTLGVIEVKKDWGLSRRDNSAVRQLGGYAFSQTAQVAILTNGDYLAVWDSSVSAGNEGFVGEAHLSKLTTKDALLLRYIASLGK